MPVRCCSFSVARADGRRRPALIVQVQDLRERKRAEREREQLIREQAARARGRGGLASACGRSSASPTPRSRRSRSTSCCASCCARIAEVLAVDARGDRAAEDDGGHVDRPGRRGRAARRRADFGAARAAARRAVRTTASRRHRRRRQATELGRRCSATAVASMLAVPLLVERPADRRAARRHAVRRARFSRRRRGLLQLAADRAALAIERARLFEREHGIAQELQRALLPDAAAAACPGCARGALPARRRGDRGRRRLVRRDRPARRPARAGHRRRRRAAASTAAATMGQLRSALRAYALDGHRPGRGPRAPQPLPDARSARTAWRPSCCCVRRPATRRAALRQRRPPAAARCVDADGDAALPRRRAAACRSARSTTPRYTEADGRARARARRSCSTPTGWSSSAGRAARPRASSGCATAIARRRPSSPRSCASAILGGALGSATSDDDVTLRRGQRAAGRSASACRCRCPGEPAGLASLRAMLRRWLRARTTPSPTRSPR